MWVCWSHIIHYGYWLILDVHSDLIVCAASQMTSLNLNERIRVENCFWNHPDCSDNEFVDLHRLNFNINYLCFSYFSHVDDIFVICEWVRKKTKMLALTAACCCWQYSFWFFFLEARSNTAKIDRKIKFIASGGRDIFNSSWSHNLVSFCVRWFYLWILLWSLKITR